MTLQVKDNMDLAPATVMSFDTADANLYVTEHRSNSYSWHDANYDNGYYNGSGTDGSVFAYQSGANAGLYGDRTDNNYYGSYSPTFSYGGGSYGHVTVNAAVQPFTPDQGEKGAVSVTLPNPEVVGTGNITAVLQPISTMPYNQSSLNVSGHFENYNFNYDDKGNSSSYQTTTDTNFVAADKPTGMFDATGSPIYSHMAAFDLTQQTTSNSTGSDGSVTTFSSNTATHVTSNVFNFTDVSSFAKAGQLTTDQWNSSPYPGDGTAIGMAILQPQGYGVIDPYHLGQTLATNLIGGSDSGKG